MFNISLLSTDVAVDGPMEKMMREECHFHYEAPPKYQKSFK